MVLIGHQFRIFNDVVVHVPKPHLSFYSLLLYQLMISQFFILVEFFLDARKQLKAIFRGIFFHIFQKQSVDSCEGELLECLCGLKIHL